MFNNKITITVTKKTLYLSFGKAMMQEVVLEDESAHCKASQA